MAISLADHHDHRTQLESQSEETFRTVLSDSLLRAISTSDIWKHFRQCSVCDCGKRFGISIQRLIRSLKRISMPHGRILLTSY